MMKFAGDVALSRRATSPACVPAVRVMRRTGHSWRSVNAVLNRLEGPCEQHRHRRIVKSAPPFDRDTAADS